MKQKQKELVEIGSIFEMPCQWSVGPLMDQFYAGFEKKKIIGVKCSACGKVYVPPREVCAKCWKPTKEIIELPGAGKLVNYTVAHVDFRGAKLDKPIIIGLVKLEGAFTSVFGEVRGVSPGDVKKSMKLRAVWADQPKGHVKDLHFEPA